MELRQENNQTQLFETLSVNIAGCIICFTISTYFRFMGTSIKEFVITDVPS